MFDSVFKPGWLATVSTSMAARRGVVSGVLSSRRRKPAALVGVLCLLLGWAIAPLQAATLGEMTISSGKGQHLQAQIKVTGVKPSMVETLSVSIGDADLSAAAGLVQTANLPFLWAELRQRSASDWYVQLLSSEPVVDPYNEVIVELAWEGGSYLREYALRFGGTTRTDARPARQTAKPAADKPAQPVAAKPAQPVRPAKAAVQAATAAPVTKPASPQATTSQPLVVPVKRGDTLAEIIRRLKLPPGVTEEQAMWGTFTANPQAFGGSPDQLRAGVNLTIPSWGSLSAISGSLARSKLVTKPKPATPRPAAKVAVQPVKPAVTLQPTVQVVTQEQIISARNPDLPLYQPERSENSSAKTVTQTAATTKQATVTQTSATAAQPKILQTRPTPTTQTIQTAQVIPKAQPTAQPVQQRATQTQVIARQLGQNPVDVVEAKLAAKLDALSASIENVRNDMSGVENSVTSLSASMGQNANQVASLNEQLSDFRSEQSGVNYGLTSKMSETAELLRTHSVEAVAAASANTGSGVVATNTVAGSMNELNQTDPTGSAGDSTADAASATPAPSVPLAAATEGGSSLFDSTYLRSVGLLSLALLLALFLVGRQLFTQRKKSKRRRRSRHPAIAAASENDAVRKPQSVAQPKTDTIMDRKPANTPGVVERSGETAAVVERGGNTAGVEEHVEDTASAMGAVEHRAPSLASAAVPRANTALPQANATNAESTANVSPGNRYPETGTTRHGAAPMTAAGPGMSAEPTPAPGGFDPVETLNRNEQPSQLRLQEESIDTPTALSWFREHLKSGRVSEQDLVKALRRYPNRQDLRLRLMERYANRQEVESFAQLAREMFQLTRGKNKEWPRAIQLGLALELEMQAMEPHLTPHYGTAEFGVERDIASPFSGDSTLQFDAPGPAPEAAPQATTSTRPAQEKPGYKAPVSRPDVVLDASSAFTK